MVPISWDSNIRTDRYQKVRVAGATNITTEPKQRRNIKMTKVKFTVTGHCQISQLFRKHFVKYAY